MQASKEGRVDVVKLLLQAGADREVKNAVSDTHYQKLFD